MAPTEESHDPEIEAVHMRMSNANLDESSFGYHADPATSNLSEMNRYQMNNRYAGTWQENYLDQASGYFAVNNDYASRTKNLVNSLVAQANAAASSEPSYLDAIGRVGSAALRGITNLPGNIYNELTDHPFNPAYRAAKHFQGAVVTMLNYAGANTLGKAEITAELLAPSLALGVAGGLVSKVGFFGRVATESAARKTLDWSRVGRDGRNAAAHVFDNHGNLKLSKEVQGVFYGHPIEVAENAWQNINKLSVKPITMGNRDVYIIPRANSGYAGGYGGQLKNFDHITVVTETGTNKVVTAFPSGRTPQLSNNYKFTFEVENEYQNSLRR